VRLEVVSWRGAEPPRERALRDELASRGFGASLWRDVPGARYEAHSHERDEALWVLEGEMIFEAADCTFRLGPGDRLELPAGTVHTAVAGKAGATYLIGERGA
jgi:quercetin dioxygenase-like cupin family protein